MAGGVVRSITGLQQLLEAFRWLGVVTQITRCEDSADDVFHTSSGSEFALSRVAYRGVDPAGMEGVQWVSG